LSTVQSDSVTWEVSAEGTYWQALDRGVWTELDHPNTGLYWRSAHTYVTYRVNPTVSLLTLEWPDSASTVESISDVPGDQGGWVNVRFHRSAYDFAGVAEPIAEYQVWRRVETVKGVARMPGAQARRGVSAGFVGADAGDFPPGEWTVAGSTPAMQQSEYVVTAETLVDSGETGAYRSVFVVSAHTADSLVFWVSAQDSGWSVDNLAPAVPTGLMLTDSLFSWDTCPDGDFRHFSVYGSQTGDFATAEWIGDTVPPAIDISGEAYAWYHVTASDSANNESVDAKADASQVSVDDLAGRPVFDFLAPARPNPVSTSATITFGLARPGHTNLAVFDVTGSEVISLVNGQLPAGRHRIVWNRESESRNRVAPGIYFVTLRSGSFSDTRKVVCLH
jgi:hypothetical protein